MLDKNNTDRPFPRSVSGDIVPGARRPGGHYGMGYGFATAHQGHDEIDLRRLFFLAFKYRRMIALLFIVGICASLMATWMMKPQYRSTAQLEVVAPSAKVLEELEVVNATADERAFLTAREKLTSRSLAQRVVFDLGLDTNAGFLFPKARFLAWNVLSRAVSGNLSTSLEDVAPEERQRIAVERVRNGLSVELVRNTSLVAVSFSHEDPVFAQMVAQQVARSYIDQGVDQVSETSVLARQFIEEQVREVRERLQASERALIDYARRQGLTVTGSDSSLIAGNIVQINEAISQAIEERLDDALLVEEIDSGRGADLPEVLANGSIGELREKVAVLSAQYQQKLTTLRPDFPDMVQLKAQIDELERQIDGAVAVMTRSVRQRHAGAIARETDLRAKLAELEATQAAFQEKNIHYTILKREVDSNRSQYENLIAKRNAVGVGSALETQSAIIVDPAAVPLHPYAPSLGLNLAAALGLCGGLAVLMVWLRESVNDVFSGPDQVETDLELPVLGILPVGQDDDIGCLLEKRDSAISEAVRSLRTALQFSGANGEPCSLAVTSTEPGEGKSTIAAKLALEFAALGRNVVLVDADFRKPRQHRLFNTDNTTGLSDMIVGTARKEDMPQLFRKTPSARLTLVTAGTVAANAPDLLVSSRMSRLNRFLSEQYDLVIFDCPPVLGLSDALILSRLAEGTLMVVSMNQTRRKSAAAALKRLGGAGGNVLGAAINRFVADGYHEYGNAYRAPRKLA